MGFHLILEIFLYFIYVMNFFCIEASGDYLSLCISDESQILFEVHRPLLKKQNRDLFPEIKKALKVSENFDAILVGLGPGNYSGTRVGIAVAEALSLTHSLPLFGISSFFGISEKETYFIVGNARRGDFFLSQKKGKKLSFPQIFSREIFLSVFLEKKRESLPFFSPELPHCLPLEEDFLSEIQHQRSSASLLTKHFLSLSEEEKEKYQSSSLTPLYLRDPHIGT